MLYKKDVNIPIPERTKYRHKLQDSMGASNVDMPSTSSDTSMNPNFSSSPEPESPAFTDASSSALNIETASSLEMEKATTEFSEDNRPEFEKMFTVENPPYFDEDIHGYQQDLVDVRDSICSDLDKPSNFSSDEESKDSIYSSLSSDSEDYISSQDTEDSETEEDVPTFSKCDESFMVTLSFTMKHHLSGQASSDLLTLLKLLGKSEHQMGDMSLKKLKELVGACDADIIHFCEKCFTIFPEDLEVYKCTQEGCPGLRYKGSEGNQVKKQKKSFFTSLSVTRQIRDLREREGIWEALTSYKSKCAEENFISDILNAEVCKNLKSGGNFLDSEHNLSLIFNTDGIPLYQSSGISLWPVYLAINELPPSMRFSRKNMILWGVWQARGKPVFQTFFQPFIKHMVQLKETGVVWKHHGQEICSKAILLLGTVDLQAKAYLTEMTMFNGRHGCITCEDEGTNLSLIKLDFHQHTIVLKHLKWDLP